ncbi:MAG TPA: septation protein IspZ [Candidatus Sulfotelmatobacter sp.]|jgi:intracellular septation protein|nr:septation protein IspZ [Candidatus Sulfotelmatobacter sp.]
MSRPVPSWFKPVTDYGPLAVFLLAYKFQGLMAATAALMACTALAVAAGWVVTRKLALVPLVTAVIVGIFGGLTLWLNDDSFIKMKPTIIYGLFSAIVGGGLILRRPVLKAVIGEALLMDEQGWRSLSLRFALFFAVMACANEVARHLLTTDQWVLWKVPGSLILTFLFMLAQAPLIQRHRLPEEISDENLGS